MGNARHEYEQEQQRERRHDRRRNEDNREQSRETYRANSDSRNTRVRSQDRVHGEIKSLATDKGFGFIRTPTKEEFFFHRSQAPEFDRMVEGNLVTFLAADAPKGPRAMGVELVK